METETLAETRAAAPDPGQDLEAQNGKMPTKTKQTFSFRLYFASLNSINLVLHLSKTFSLFVCELNKENSI